jgi:molecular chaperone DnaJ
MQLRLSGEGEVGERGAPSGDLYVVISVKEHEYFERDNHDIIYETTIPFTTASLGGKLEVPTLSGKATLDIPAGTQTNTIFRMRGKGLPDLSGHGVGNQNVRVIVEVPTKISKRARELLEQLEHEIGTEGEAKRGKGLFGKIKDVF